MFGFILTLLTIHVFPQNNPYVKVIDEENVFLSNPWAGGLNAVQFGEIDLNLDGLHDLFVFDRHGNRKLSFINNGVYNVVSYSLHQEFSDLLPDLNNWAIFVDYNNDNKVDIFTYSPVGAGMVVYKNVSDNVLKFELVVYPFLESLYGEMYLNLLVTEVDYPGISDVDNDGDLDILAFWGLGQYVNYHRNMSMEKYGHADSLDYELREDCWGLFAESEESNKLYLDTCFNQQSYSNRSIDKTRHTGSTFLMLDLDQDTIQDLLLGDIDFPGLIALMNDGSKFNAHIASYDTLFPANDKKVSLFSFPAAAYIDVNNDNRKDLLVSPFDPQLETAENKNSIWYYQNTGANNKPFFTLKSRNFLQSDMIDRGSGAYPVLYDWNQDGLQDLFIGNFGFFDSAYYDNSFRLYADYTSRIAYYRNTGTAQAPQFQLWEDDFGGLSLLSKTAIAPTFGDIDGDEDIDILTGYEAGRLILVKNQNNEFDIVDTNYFNIDVGNFSAPQLFDLDRDGLLDLIIGEQSGNLNYYQNQGSVTNPDFIFITDSLGKVRVTDIPNPFYGYSVPYFFRDEAGVTHLVVGSEDGLIFYYTNIDGNLEGTFTLSDDLGELLDTNNVSFDRGIRTAAAVAEISKDGKLEMVVGNYSGGLEYFNGNANVSPGFSEYQTEFKKLHIFPNPANSHINIRTIGSYVRIDQIQIFDMNGRLIDRVDKPKVEDGYYYLLLKDLKAGVYVVKAVTAKGFYTGRLIIADLPD